MSAEDWGAFDDYRITRRPAPTRRRLSDLTPAEGIKLAEEALRKSGARAKVVRLVPEWRPGDVVVIRFNEGGKPFTYVRGLHKWPGEYVDQSDDEVNMRFEAGQATPVLQAGGEPFDEGRLA